MTEPEAIEFLGHCIREVAGWICTAMIWSAVIIGFFGFSKTTVIKKD